MAELKRVLKKNGQITLITPTDYHSFFYGEWTHVRPYNHESLPEMLKDLGFKNVDWYYPRLRRLPKMLQRYLRFPLFPLRNYFWKEVVAIGKKA